MAGIFFYVTYKLVVLKDSRLGLLYYVLAFLALLFTVVEIFVKKGYLELDTHPHGTIKLILSDDFSNTSFQAGDLEYCQGKVPCKFLDPWDLNWPSESRAVTITSYAKDRIQKRSISTSSPVDTFETTEEKKYFTLGPEYVVIKVDHAVVASKFTDSAGKERLAASHRQLRGHLVDTNGRILRTVSSAEKDGGKSDRLTLQELLQAAGVGSLEKMSDIVDARGRSFRQRGCILRVNIFYHNWQDTWIGTSPIEYRYQVHRMPYVDYSSKQVEPLLNKEEIMAEGGVHQATWRLQRKRYAIRVEFIQTGTLGMFSLSTLIMKLVSGAALLTLIATAIDFLALYALPNKKTYKDIVYEESPLLKTLGKKTKTTDSTHSQKEDDSHNEKPKLE